MLELRGENSRKGDDLMYDHVCYVCLVLLLMLYFTSSAIYSLLLLLFCLKFCFPYMSTVYSLKCIYCIYMKWCGEHCIQIPNPVAAL